MKLKNSIVNKKKVIVIGGAGFIGKNIICQLLKRNFFVISVDVKDPGIKSKNHKFYMYSLSKFVSKKFTFNNLYSVIHLAEEPKNNLYILKPRLVLNNLSNIFKILNYICSFKKKPIFVYSSTKQVEIDLIKKNINPYSSSKKLNEDLIKFYSEKYGIKSFILKFSEVFSYKNNPKDKALFTFINKMQQNKNIIVDNVKHDFEKLNINVITSGVIKILKSKVSNGYVNFYGNKINILKLLALLKKKINSNSKIIIKKKLNNLNFNKFKIYKFKTSKKDRFINNLDLIIKNEMYK